MTHLTRPPQADLEFYFSALYPDMIEEIIMMRIIPDLEAAVAKRDAVLDKLEHKIVMRERYGESWGGEEKGEGEGGE